MFLQITYSQYTFFRLIATIINVLFFRCKYCLHLLFNFLYLSSLQRVDAPPCSTHKLTLQCIMFLSSNENLLATCRATVFLHILFDVLSAGLLILYLSRFTIIIIHAFYLSPVPLNEETRAHGGPHCTAAPCWRFINPIWRPRS